MIKFLLARYENEEVEFTTTYNFSGLGQVIIMGNGKPGIASGMSIFPGTDIKHVRRV